MSAIGRWARWPWLGFLFVWCLFYLATPLELTFSTTEEMSLNEVELTELQRVDRNIEQVTSGHMERQLALLALAGYGLWNLVRPGGPQLRVRGALGLAVLFFLGWCVLSLTWSDQPLVTVRKLGVLACLCLGALGMARMLTLEGVAVFALFSFVLLLVIGLVCELALGTFRPFHPLYRFSGLDWPAFSGWCLSLLVLAVLLLRRSRPLPGGVLEALGVVAFVLLLLTKTRASLGAMLAALFFHVCMVWPTQRKIALGLSLGFVVSLIGLGGEVLGKDMAGPLVQLLNLGRTESAADISGRAGLWAELFPYIQRQPLGGYGYDTFWTPARLFQVGQTNWGAPDAHNTYINLTLGLGLIGTGAYCFVLLAGLVRAWAGYWASGALGYLFACEALLILLINAGFVSTPLAPALYSFVTLMLLARLGFVEGPAP